jgi:acetoin utilization protein AcuB
MTPTRVGDIMQADVTTLKATDTLGLADDIMELGRIRHLPVVSGDRLVGIISQRDLFRAAISSVLSMRKATERAWLARIPVSEVMIKRVHTVDPQASVRQALDVMLHKRIGCLPVLADEKLVGLLSETDCLRYLARILALPEIKAELPELVE